MNGRKYVEENISEMTEKLLELVSIPSVMEMQTAHSEGAPFGRNIKIALDYALDMGRSFGMHVKNYDGFAGEITVGSEEFLIGILGHIDVVAAGKGWNTEPFEPVVIDGEIIGRGVADDKAPIVSCLYAMKYLNDNHLIPEGVGIRLILGTDEEEEWRGIEEYIKRVEKLPDLSFVPDGYFPLVNCEKGLLDFNLIWTQKPRGFRAIEGGSGRNIVAGEAICKLEGGMQEILVKGTSTHAMSPEKGENAISKLFSILADKGLNDELVETYNSLIGFGYNGENMDMDWKDEISGRLTFNVGKIKVNDEGGVLECNVRYPATLELEKVEGQIKEKIKDTYFEYVQTSNLPSICISEESELVKALLEAYRKITGDMKNNAYSIGGATYARAIPNAVSFGPLFPYEEELAHEANEKLSIDSYKKMTEVYIQAIMNLIKTREK